MSVLLAFIDVTGPMFWLIRILAGLGGLIFGYILSGPLLRLGYRLIRRKQISSDWLLVGKTLTGILLGLLLYYYIPLGGGGGWGWGPGQGGGPGKGPGPGGGSTVQNGVSKGEPGKKSLPGKETPPVLLKSTREVLKIELLGGPRYKKEGHYYLLHGQEPAVTLEEVETVIKKAPEKFEVHIILTDQSVSSGHPAVRRLRHVLRQFQIPTVEPPDEEMK